MPLVDPPNPQVAFINPAAKLTVAANSFLTKIVAALNGTTSSAGISQIVLGNGVTIYSGTQAPNGFVPGNVGDMYSNQNGLPGAVFYVKNSGLPGGRTGWTAIA